MIGILCPQCRASFKVGEDDWGKSTKCPQCHTPFVIGEMLDNESSETANVGQTTPPPASATPTPAPKFDVDELLNEQHEGTSSDHKSKPHSRPRPQTPRQNRQYPNLKSYLEISSRIVVAVTVASAICVVLVTGIVFGQSVSDGDSIAGKLGALVFLVLGSGGCAIFYIGSMASIEFVHVILDIEANTRQTNVLLEIVDAA